MGIPKIEKDAQDGMQKAYLQEFIKKRVKNKKETILQSVERAKNTKELDEIMARGEFQVILLADNETDGIPQKFIKALQEKIETMGFVCVLGNEYYDRGGCCFTGDIEKLMDNCDLFILINGDHHGTMDESKKIRDTPEWKKKSLFFFQYKDGNHLVGLAKDKQFPIDFKYPIPYLNEAELEAKVLFGVLHWHYYQYNKKKGGKQDARLSGQ